MSALLALTMGLSPDTAHARGSRPEVNITMKVSPTKAKVGDQLNLTIRVVLKYQAKNRRRSYGFGFGMSRPDYDLSLPPNLKKTSWWFGPRPIRFTTA